MLPKEIQRECQSIIHKGSKSFSWASLLLGRKNRDGAYCLYAWCRFCDDQTDIFGEGGSPLQREAILRSLFEETEKAFTAKRVTSPIFIALQHAAETYQIPHFYAKELLEGMKMDLMKKSYESFNELSLYCYRVAGTVGLMMSHIMGVSDPKALRNAADLGMAMQLTNICRDVFDDAAIGRVYLPQDLLREEGANLDLPITDLRNRAAVVAVVKRLLERAQGLYDSGNRGLISLSFRPACAVSVAKEVYRAIGTEVVRRGDSAWDQRVWTSKARKIWLMVKGVGIVLSQLPQRMLKPWKQVPLNTLWRHA